VSRARKQDRFVSTLAVSYREPTSNEPSLGNCVDISPSGMFIETVRPAARGVLVRFECVTPDAQGVVRGTARVMWLRPHNDAQGKAGMGVRFVRLEPGSARVIEELIAAAGTRTSKIPSEGPQARAIMEEPSVVLTAERTIGPTNRSSSVPPKGLRAPTLRGMYPADVRSPSGGTPSSDAPKSADPAPATTQQATSDEPARESARAASADASSALRERIDRNKKDSGPPGAVQPAQSAKPARNFAAATLFGNSSPMPTPPLSVQDASAVDRTTAPDGSMPAISGSARPAATASNKGATVHDLSPPPPPGMSAAGGARRGSDHALGVPSPPPPPWKSRQSERPPEPGGVEVIRTVTVSTDPRSDGRGHHQQPFHAHAEPVRPHSQPRPATVVTGLPGAEDTHSPAWEPIVEPVRPAMRPDRAPPEISLPYALPDEIGGDATRPGRNYTGWIVVGTGILATLGLALVFGRPPAGIPGGAGALQGTAPSAVDAFAAPKQVEPTPTPVVETAPTQVVLIAHVEPPGAKVTALGQTISAPGRFAFPIESVRFPLRVRAEMPGFGATELSLPRQIFSTAGAALTHELELSLQPAEGTATATESPAPSSSSRSRERRRSPTTTPEAASEAPAATSMLPAPPPGSELTVTPAAPTPAEPAAAGAQTPLARALDCLSRGDNACVLSALEGTSGPRELDLQIETHRAQGNAAAAESMMRRYVELHPEGKRAAQYRRTLGIAEPPSPDP
jgi:hypothetical protein